MVVRDLHVKLLSLVLVAAGLSLMYAKVIYLGSPLTPHQESSIWVVEARVEFKAQDRAVLVNFDIPDKLEDFLKLDELYVSRNYGLNVEVTGNDRRAEWSVRRARGLQRLYYRIELVPQEGRELPPDEKKKVPKAPERPKYEEPFASAVDDILNKVRGESADVFTFVSQLLVQLNDPSPDKNILLVRKGVVPQTDKWVERIIYVLAGARVTARMVRGISLEDGVSNIELKPWLEVHNGTRWEGFDPTSGHKGYPPDFLRWRVGSDPLLIVQGGSQEKATFSAALRSHTATDVANERGTAAQSPLAAWSLFKLPLSTQNIYRILLMIPVGALVVVFMRTLIGIPTFGTFMPVLLALAFRETELAWGIALCCLIVGAALTVRFYLERLKLLLVPRLSAVLVLVVLLMLAISLLSNALGLDRGLSIGLFPIVILTMVVERMSIVWEELGPTDAFKEGFGSLLIAILAYFVMTNDYLQHLLFVFPETLLVLLAIFISLGRYTGYRLSELLRFRDLAREVNHDTATRG